MDYQLFYKQLFQPIEDRIGAFDNTGIIAIMGFDGGGSVNLSTIGRERLQFVTYVTCELAVRNEQQPAKFGRYEVMMTCDDGRWARDILTRIGHMSLHSVFDHGHTVDISPIVAPDFPLQGLIMEAFAQVTIDAQRYGILRAHGITRSELEFAREFGKDELLERLRRAGVYPQTSVSRRESVDLTVS